MFFNITTWWNWLLLLAEFMWHS